jgi:hypothetical protein
MGTIGSYTGLQKERANKAPRPVQKERAFHFRRVSPGFYISNRKHTNGQHVALEKIHSGWILRFYEGREISRHTTRKGAIFALENGVD